MPITIVFIAFLVKGGICNGLGARQQQNTSSSYSVKWNSSSSVPSSTSTVSLSSPTAGQSSSSYQPIPISSTSLYTPASSSTYESISEVVVVVHNTTSTTTGTFSEIPVFTNTSIPVPSSIYSTSSIGSSSEAYGTGLLSTFQAPHSSPSVLSHPSGTNLSKSLSTSVLTPGTVASQNAAYGTGVLPTFQAPHSPPVVLSQSSETNLSTSLPTSVLASTIIASQSAGYPTNSGNSTGSYIVGTRSSIKSHTAGDSTGSTTTQNSTKLPSNQNSTGSPTTDNSPVSSTVPNGTFNATQPARPVGTGYSFGTGRPLGTGYTLGTEYPSGTGHMLGTGHAASTGHSWGSGYEPRPRPTVNKTGIPMPKPPPNGTCGGVTINIPSATLDYWYTTTFDFAVATFSVQYNANESQTGWTLLSATTTFNVTSALQDATTYYSLTTVTSGYNQSSVALATSVITSTTPEYASTVVVTQTATGTMNATTGTGDIPASAIITPPPASTVISGLNGTLKTALINTPFVYFSEYAVESEYHTVHKNGSHMCMTLSAVHVLNAPYALYYDGDSPDGEVEISGDLPDDFAKLVPHVRFVLGTWVALPTLIVALQIEYAAEAVLAAHTEETVSAPAATPIILPVVQSYTLASSTSGPLLLKPATASSGVTAITASSLDTSHYIVATPTTKNRLESTQKTLDVPGVTTKIPQETGSSGSGSGSNSGSGSSGNTGESSNSNSGGSGSSGSGSSGSGSSGSDSSESGSTGSESTGSESTGSESTGSESTGSGSSGSGSSGSGSSGSGSTGSESTGSGSSGSSSSGSGSSGSDSSGSGSSGSNSGTSGSNSGSSGSSSSSSDDSTGSSSGSSGSTGSSGSSSGSSDDSTGSSSGSSGSTGSSGSGTSSSGSSSGSNGGGSSDGSPGTSGGNSSGGSSGSSSGENSGSSSSSGNSGSGVSSGSSSGEGSSGSGSQGSSGSGGKVVAPVIVPIGSSKVTINAGSTVKIGTQTLIPGGKAVTIGGIPVSLGSSAVMVGGTTYSFTASPAQVPGPVAATAIAFGSSTITQAPVPVFVVSGSTIHPGQVVTISGTRISAASNGGGLVIGSSTIPLAVPESPVTLSTAGKEVVINPTPAFVISGQTLEAGGSPITVDGTHLSLAVSGTAIVIGSKTSQLGSQDDAVDSGTTRGALLTIGSKKYTANAATQFSLGSGVVLTPGGQVTVDGTVIRLGPSGSVAVVNGVSQTLSPAIITPAPAFNLGGSVIESTGGSTFVIDGKTLTPGGAITVSGSTISYASGGGAVVVNGVTQTLSQATASSVLTVGGKTYTATSGSYIIQGQTLSPGGVVTLQGGTTLSLAPSGTAVIVNGVTSAISAGATIPPSVLTIGGHTYTAQGGSSYVIGGQTLTPGGIITLSGATTISLASSGSIVVINGVTSTIPPPKATSPSVLKVGGRTYTAQGGSSYVIGGQTLTPGGVITLSGDTTVSLDSSGFVVVINGVTSTIPSPAATNAASVLTIGGKTYTATSGSYVIDGKTLTPGDLITLSGGTTVSLGSSGSVVVINGITSTISPPAGATPTSVLTIGGKTYKATSGSYVIDGKTLTSGGIITISGGTTLSLGSSVLVINGHTSTLPTAVATGGIITIDGSSFKPLPGTGVPSYVIGGKTLHAAGSEITVLVSGHTYIVSLGAGATTVEIEELGPRGRVTATVYETLISKSGAGSTATRTTDVGGQGGAAATSSPGSGAAATGPDASLQNVATRDGVVGTCVALGAIVAGALAVWL